MYISIDIEKLTNNFSSESKASLCGDNNRYCIK